MEDLAAVAGDSRIWDIISHASSNAQLLILVGGPSALLVLLASIILFFSIRKRRREQASDKLFFQQHQAASPADLMEPADEQLEPQASSPKIWGKSLWEGLSKTRLQFSQSLGSLFTGSSLSEESFEKIHETLFRADIGVEATDRLVDTLKKEFRGKADASWGAVKEVLKKEIEQIVDVRANAADAQSVEHNPLVILVAGVNGVGKTTTIAKLAARYKEQSQKSVLLCAADTFRAAAIDQLKVWGERVGCEVIAHKEASDPAAVVFDAVKAAKSRKSDVLIIDTAGRLHNKKELMDELSKIHRVIQKEISTAPHEVWLVIDATTGQNAVQQAKVFRECVAVTGIIATKLDGTSKGGVLVAISSLLGIPIKFLGMGEAVEDLKDFNAREFAKALFEA